MRTIAEIAAVLPVSVHDAENWLRNKNLVFRVTRFQPTTQGRARLYTRENAFVLGAMGAMINAGAAPTQAILIAERLLEAKKMGKMRRWLVVGDGLFESTRSTNDPDTERLATELNAITVSMIDMEAIHRRVDKLFEQR